MPKYTIHAYPIVRVTHAPIEADSPQAALKALMDGDEEFRTYKRVFGEDWEDDITAYLVDTVGDEDYEESLWFTREGEIDQTMNRPDLPEDATKQFTFTVTISGIGKDVDEA